MSDLPSVVARFRSLLILALVATACTHLDAASRLDRRAHAHGLEVLTLDAGETPIRAYRRGSANTSGTSESGANMSGTNAANMSGTDGRRTLHIYLEGDGRPFVTPTRIAREPHAHDALAFRLMERDPAPAVYLGRPCYHPELRRTPCTPDWWTNARYGEPVVDAMSEAIRQLALDGRIESLTLIGYSGGGTLAVLIAERLATDLLPTTDLAVVTLAANLDVGAWARHHDHTPLEGSLDPATRPPLPTRIRQLHLVGARDSVVPPAHTEAWAATRRGAKVERIADFDHRCCWVASWREHIQRFSREQTPNALPS